MKLFVVLFMMMFGFPLIAESKPPSSYEITGISGKVLANVKKRLQELQKSKPLVETDPMELQHKILKAIQPFGYFHPEIDIQRNQDKLHIRIRSGEPLLVTSVLLQMVGPGAQEPELLQLKQDIPLAIGQVLSMEVYNQVKLNWINAAENLGYLHAHFKKAEIAIDEDLNRADIALIFDTDFLYRFGSIQFDSTSLDPKLLQRYIPFQPEEPYSTNRILQLDKSLSTSGYFNSVLIKPEITDSTTVPIHILLHPVAKYSYTLGGGFGTDTGPRGRAGLHVIPVNRKGHQFHATAQGSMTQNVLQAQYLIPGNNPMTDQYSLAGNFSNLNYDSGYSNAFLVSLSQQHHLNDHQRILSLNGLYEGFNYKLQENSYQFLLYPKATWTWSHTENKLFSPTGYSVTLNGLGASKVALSTINMGQVSLDAKAAYTIEPLRLRLYGHLLQGLTLTDDINQVPLSLALFLGGTENLKGYAYNSIGPGKAISYGGFEIQKAFRKKWYALGFFDAGYVNNPLIKNPQLDFGLGLMWVSPVGPIKLGLAQALDDRFQWQRGTKPRLVISMGSDL